MRLRIVWLDDAFCRQRLQREPIVSLWIEIIVLQRKLSILDLSANFANRQLANVFSVTADVVSALRAGRWRRQGR